MDSFIEVQEGQLETMEEMLRKRLPKAGRMYNVLTLVRRDFFTAAPEFSTMFYAFGGHVRDPDTAFIVSVQRLKKSQMKDTFILMSHPETLTPSMLSALEDLLDWSQTLRIGELQEGLVEFFQDRVARQRSNAEVLSVNFDLYDCFGFYMRKQKALELSEDEVLPPAYVLKPLKVEDAETVTHNWRKGDTLDLVTYSIRNLPSIGIYAETDTMEGDELVSWAIIGPYGAMNALTTLSPHRGKGLGKRVVRALAKAQVNPLDFIPVARVEKTNVPSIKIMEGLGFRKSADVYWIVYEEKTLKLHN